MRETGQDDVTDEFSFGLAITTTLKCFMSFLPLFVVFTVLFVADPFAPV